MIERMAVVLNELKFAPSDSGEMTFTGYGAVFGNVDAYGDVIQKGAFAKSIHDARTSGLWPAMLEQHGGFGMSASDLTPIGVWTDLEEDNVGLRVSGKLAPTVRGKEMHALMKMSPRPAINGLSIGYIPIKWKMRSAPEEPRRTLEEVSLKEISPVTFPANGKARVSSVKSIEDIAGLADAERMLRELGMSKSEATAFVSQVKLLGRSDSVHDDRSDSASSELMELASVIKGARLFV